MPLKKSQRSLKDWGSQKWRTSDGKPSMGKKRYLPDKAWKALSASEKAATTTLATLQELEQVQDIDVSQRADNTFLMYDTGSQKYLHVDAAQIVDLADSVDDDAFDAGTF